MHRYIDRVFRFASWTALLLSLLCECSSLRAAESTVFAAASLSDVLQEIARDYEKASRDRVTLSFAGSSTLARQIAEGAKVDLFFSADEDKVNQLEAKGMIRAGSRRALLSNTLVFVVARESQIKLPQDLSAVRRIALAETRTVPAGVYARRFLEQAGLWKELADRVIPTENVRAALAAVEGGNAEVAIVYKTDAAMSRKVKVAYEVPRTEGPQISYVLAMTKNAPSPAAAEKLASYLAGPEAARVFRRFGFIVTAESQR